MSKYGEFKYGEAAYAEGVVTPEFEVPAVAVTVTPHTIANTWSFPVNLTIPPTHITITPATVGTWIVPQSGPSTVWFLPLAGDPLPIGQQSSWRLEETMPSGTAVGVLAHSTWVYAPGGEIERVMGSFRSTMIDEYMVGLVSACDPAFPTAGPADYWHWNDTQRDFDVAAGDGGWLASQPWAQNLYVSWQRTDQPAELASDVSAWWANLVVFHKRYSWNGLTVDVGAHPGLDARGIVYDLLGRGLNSVVEVDPNRFAPGTPWGTPVAQACWWDGASAREVLAYAEAHAPSMWWAIGEPGVTGLPRFTIGRWDGPPRYVFAPGMAGVELSGGAADVANRVLVRYVGSTYGQTRSVWVAEITADVPVLTDAGLTRTMTVDLTSEGLMTTSQARLRGVAALRQASRSATSGRVTVSQPVMDLVEGRMVEPWEVQDGSPVIVCDAPLDYSRSTSLAESTGTDGVSVFRAAAVAYDIGSNTATISLDGGSRSLLGRFKTDAAPRRYDTGNPRV